MFYVEAFDLNTSKPYKAVPGRSRVDLNRSEVNNSSWAFSRPSLFLFAPENICVGKTHYPSLPVYYMFYIRFQLFFHVLNAYFLSFYNFSACEGKERTEGQKLSFAQLSSCSWKRVLVVIKQQFIARLNTDDISRLAAH